MKMTISNQMMARLKRKKNKMKSLNMEEILKKKCIFTSTEETLKDVEPFSLDGISFSELPVIVDPVSYQEWHANLAAKYVKENHVSEEFADAVAVSKRNYYPAPVEWIPFNPGGGSFQYDDIND